MGKIQDTFATIRDVFQPVDCLPADEIELWARATSLIDLGRLNVLWLNRDLSATVAYPEPCDVDEDLAPGLTETLVALNCAGFYTYNSQAAGSLDYAAESWEAWVDGFADDATFEWLTAAVSDTPYLLWAWPPAESRSRWRRTRLVGDEPPGRKGWSESCSELEWRYRYCSQEAIDAVCSAWQVTVYDPEPGRNDMWAYLQQAAEDRP